MKNLWLAACLMLSVTLHAQTPAPPTRIPPDVAALSFYHWYLDSLDNHTVPTDNLSGPIRQMISPNLIHRLQRLLRNGDLESDYFLKAQDFLPDWKSTIHATPAQIKGLSATTVVTLGSASSEHKLQVTLLQQDHLWKIDSVRAMPPPKSP